MWIGAGVIALGLYGFVATLQPDAHFGRILAAYGGVFVAGSLIWGMVADGFRPDRWDVTGALISWSAWPSSCMHPGPRPDPGSQPLPMSTITPTAGGPTARTLTDGSEPCWLELAGRGDSCEVGQRYPPRGSDTAPGAP